METATDTFRTVAAELAAAFETATRATSGETFHRIRRDAAPWIAGDGAASIMHAAHVAVDGPDCRLPCDYIYRLAARAAEFIAGHDSADAARDSIGEFADSAVDVSIPRLFSWAADHANNRALADEFAADSFDVGAAMAGGFESGAVAALQGGQYLAAERVAAAMIDAVETEAANR